MTITTQDQVTSQERAAENTATALALVAAWNTLHLAQLELIRVLEKRRADSITGSARRMRAAVQVFLAAVATFDRTARAVTERWAARDLPILYRDGALNALERAVHTVQRTAALFSWTARHQAAVTAISAQFYTDMISRISEAVRRAQAFAREAQAQYRTEQGIDRQQMIADHPLDTVVYRDQSKHPVLAWATGALKAQATTATNAGALNYGQWDLESAWFECTDGPECGFQGHQDTDLAHGTIRSAEDASAWPQSHFGCVRQWIPRPDLNARPGLASGDSA
jgi:hypothetical protein